MQRIGGLWRAWLVGAAVGAAGAASVAAQQGIAAYDYENLGLRGVGAEISAVFPTDVKSTFGLGARLDFGYLGPHVRTLFRAAWWSSDLEDGEVVRLATQIADLVEEQTGSRPDLTLGKIERQAVSLGLDFDWMPLTESLVRPYAGVGLELYVLSGNGDAIDHTFVDESLDLLTGGVSGIVGLEFDAGRYVTVFGEARGALTSNLRSLGLVAGAMLTW